ncbi:MAG: efflux RND transporter permease subunit [Planctomycetia bacterium]|nr:efflux RND transporter permease subunit [Planctomycetia bacterium]
MLIVFLSIAAFIYGSYITATLPIDVFPDLDRPRVTIMTEAPGLASEEVETLVTFPLESALLGATGVQAVRSQSAIGLSVVYAEFDWNTNIYLARQTVQERLSSIADGLPPGVRPQMAPVSSIMGQIMHVGLSRKNDDGSVSQAMELRTIADWIIRPRLLKIPGVAQVIVMGGGRKQYQVLLDPNLLVEQGVTLKEVEDAIKNNNLNASGGFMVNSEGEQTIRVLGRLGPKPERVLDEIKSIPVKFVGSRSVQVRHIAKVVEAPQLKRGDSSVNGKDAVILTITKQPHTDTRRLTEDVKSALKELEPSLPKSVEINSELFQLKRFIDTGIYNVGEALVIGAGLVLVILFLFLLNVRTTFISLAAIPLSLVMTGLSFKLISWITGTPLSINVMTLGGIAVALGELVDDSIVDVENIFRRLKENSLLEKPRPALKVIYEASVEIRSAIVFGTAMVIMVFIPLFALSGIEGRLFAPLGVAYIVSILSSLIVSLTVTPVLSYYLLSNTKSEHAEVDSPLLRILKWGASHVIRFSMRWAGTLLLSTWIIVGFSGYLLTHLGADFLPPFDEGSVQVNLTLPPGSSLQDSNQIARMADKVFRKMQKSDSNTSGEVLQFARRTGRAELDEHAEPVGNTEYILSMNQEAHLDREAVIKKILHELRDGLPGVQIEVEQPLAHLISHMLSGVTAQIAIKIYGDDLDTLRQLAERIKGSIGSVPGISSLAIESQRQINELHIRLKPEQLTYFGVDRAYVAEFVGTALRGESLSQVLEGQRRFDLVVWVGEEFRNDPTKLGKLRLELPGGRGQVPLSELATIEVGAGPNTINRENARRRIVLRCNALGRDLASVVRDIQSRIGDLQKSSGWPSGYFVEYAGQFESQERATSLIAILAGASFVAMFVVLYMLYPSPRIVLQILNALPAAFIGGVVALALTGQTLTVASMVGFISLGGIAARNGILLVSHYFHLMKHEGEKFSEEMVLRGSLERLAPVLMTALTAGIGLLPLVLEGQKPGREILYPVATVILGGLITSTLSEYLLHPGLFWKFSGKDADHIVHEMESDATSVSDPCH